MKHLLIFCLLLASLSAVAQAKRVYYVGQNQVSVDNSDGTKPILRSVNEVSVDGDDDRIVVTIDGATFKLLPAQFLNSSGVAWGNTVTTAYAAFRLSAGSSSGGGSTTPTPPGFGVSPPTSADYTSSATITTTNAVKIFLENIGSANASFSYAGLSYTILPNEQRSFAVDTDPTTGKLVPFAALSVNGTASTIRVTLVPKQ